MQIRFPLGTSVECISRRSAALTCKSTRAFGRTTPRTLYLPGYRGKITAGRNRNLQADAARNRFERFGCSAVTIEGQADRFKIQTTIRVRKVSGIFARPRCANRVTLCREAEKFLVFQDPAKSKVSHREIFYRRWNTLWV